jgi:hypothetical protein
MYPYALFYHMPYHWFAAGEETPFSRLKWMRSIEQHGNIVTVGNREVRAWSPSQ